MERKIITIFVTLCILLGFFSLILFLPQQSSEPTASEGIKVSDLLKQLYPESAKEKQDRAAIDQVRDRLQQLDADDQTAAVYVDSKADSFGAIRPLANGIDFREYFELSKRERPLWVAKMAEKFSFEPYKPLAEAPARGRVRFTTPHQLKYEVEFWRNVYGNYHEDHSIFHDSRHLAVVYGVIDFDQLMRDPSLDYPEKRRIRSEIEEYKKEEIATYIDNCAADRTSIGSLALANHVCQQWHLFNRTDRKKANDRIRAQWGQYDHFKAGLERASAYLPHLESIFESAGIPKEIARLTFVESMFQINARSHVGASGPYQFMPATAKHYRLRMNHWVDERLDPFIAAKAATRLLSHAHRTLSSWPLAINAYNAGTRRMSRAVKKIRTRNIAEIIHRYEDRAYGFASRNFYPEFLAALEVSEYWRNYFPSLNWHPPMKYVEIQLKQSVSPWDLAAALGMDVQLLKEYNPAYKSHVFQNGGSLPARYTLRFPGSDSGIYQLALNEIYSEQKQQPKRHIVQKGETLYQIALRYGTSVSLIQSHNQLATSRIYPGQMLAIPAEAALVMKKKDSVLQ